MAADYSFELERIEDLDTDAIDEIALIMAEIILNYSKGRKKDTDEPATGSFQFGKDS
jgi:hypothetical protein